jgi:hypothetical protein
MEKKAFEMAKSMLSDGMPLDVIAKYTSLPRQSLEKLSV